LAVNFSRQDETVYAVIFEAVGEELYDGVSSQKAGLKVFREQVLLDSARFLAG